MLKPKKKTNDVKKQKTLESKKKENGSAENKSDLISVAKVESNKTKIVRVGV